MNDFLKFEITKISWGGAHLDHPAVIHFYRKSSTVEIKITSEDARSQDARSQDTRCQDARCQDARSQDVRSQDTRCQDARFQDARSQDARSQDARCQDTRSQDARFQDAENDTKSTQLNNGSVIGNGLTKHNNESIVLPNINQKEIRDLESN